MEKNIKDEEKYSFNLLKQFESTIFEKIKKYCIYNGGSISSYLTEEFYLTLFRNFPTLIGHALRSFFLKKISSCCDHVYVEKNVELRGIKFINFGKNIYLDRNSYLHAFSDAPITLENNVVIGESVRLHCWNFRQIKDSQISIGANTNVGHFSFIHGHGGVNIGKNCLMGPYCIIDCSYHILESTEIPMLDQPMTYKKTVIEDDVWMGARVLIINGSRIGKGSVIGAGSLVNKDIPPYSIAVGNPVRVIDSRYKK